MGHSGVILVSRIGSWRRVNGFKSGNFEQLYQSKNILLWILSAYFSFIVTEADNDWSHWDIMTESLKNLLLKSRLNNNPPNFCRKVSRCSDREQQQGQLPGARIGGAATAAPTTLSPNNTCALPTQAQLLFISLSLDLKWWILVKVFLHDPWWYDLDVLVMSLHFNVFKVVKVIGQIWACVPFAH